MHSTAPAFLFLVLLFLNVNSAFAQDAEKLILDHADQFELVLTDDGYVTYVTGNVVFKTETGHIYCDSARWLRGENARLNGNVLFDDAEYRLESDSKSLL